MTRFRSTMTRLAMALGALVMLQPALGAQGSATPVVAVLYFDNNSIGKDRADYDGLGKGIADMLITDLAASSNVRVVERERIQKLLEEQELTRAGRIDNSTAVRLGKILQAQYMIVGGFLNDGRGTMVLTARAIETETSRITNPQRVQTKDDDVLGLIAQLSTRLTRDLKLPAVQRVGDAGASSPSNVQPAGAPEPVAPVNVQTAPTATASAASAEKPAAAPTATQASTTEPAKAAPAKAAPARQVAKQPSAPSRKLDTRAALLYAKALDESDHGNKEKATELYRAVLTRFPDFAPAKQKLAQLSAR